VVGVSFDIPKVTSTWGRLFVHVSDHFPILSRVLVLGVLAGSSLWFLTLGYVSRIFRKELDTGGFRWVSRIAGILIMLAGVAAFVSMI
jgi:arginine exporter protein ArgO